jgi:hypothetical protein
MNKFLVIPMGGTAPESVCRESWNCLSGLPADCPLAEKEHQADSETHRVPKALLTDTPRFLETYPK